MGEEQGEDMETGLEEEGKRGRKRRCRGKGDAGERELEGKGRLGGREEGKVREIGR